MRFSWHILILFSLIFSACHQYEIDQSKQIFRYNISEGVSSLDPAFARSLENVSTVGHLFNGLVQMDEELNIQACIAKSWKVLDSGLRYQFVLRNDVYFHDSPVFVSREEQRVKAKDFVYSLNRLVDQKLLSPGKWVMNSVRRTESGTLDIVAVNDSVLEIKLQHPFPPFLGILSMAYCSVVPEKVILKNENDFRAHPIGTGPFKFKYWKEGSKLVLLKNDNYFEKDTEGNYLPYLDALAISFTKDEEVSFLKFLKGEMDYLSGLKGSYKDELLDATGQLNSKYKSKIKLVKSPYLNTEYLGFLLNSDSTNIVSNKWIRKAINFGFDRKKMLKYLRNNMGTPAEQGFIPKGLPSYDSSQKGYQFNADSVYYYLAKAGYMKGNLIPTITLSTTAQYIDLCEYIQHQLKAFGFDIQIEVNQAATNNEMIAFGKKDFFRKSWVADYPDAENYLSLFYSKNFSPNGPNYTHFQSKQYDSLYEAAMKLPDLAQRKGLYRKMNQLIIDEAPVVPLFYDEVVRFIPPSISGVGVNPMNILVLKHARKALN
tara:strand:- start:286 stop:1914 length:1629 start_codon:yes stop_codon:yes gene_type:complete